ncbi:MAG: GDSL-type esterase/lipase family protein [Armatimonadota bacterium]
MKLPLLLVFSVLIGTGSGQPASPAPAGPETKAEPAKEEKKPAPVDLGALLRFHYENRVRAFRDQNQVFRNVVLLGDSITEGFEVPRYFPGRRVLNRGIGGDVIGNQLAPDDPRGVLKRLDESIFDCAPSHVFLMIGINDLNGGHTVDGMETGYRELLRRVKEHSPQLRVYVQSVLPTRGDFAARNEPVREFNRRLERLAREAGYPYLDLHRLFVDDGGELKAEYTPDGLHLNDAGYRVWLREVERVLGWDRPQPAGAGGA